jgi:molybdopterin converting factor small subunit
MAVWRYERVIINWCMNITVRFTGVLAEVMQTTIKHYRDVRSFGDLKLRIEDDFPEMIYYNYRISVNDEIVSGEPVIVDGDDVIFMVPFTGG